VFDPAGPLTYDPRSADKLNAMRVCALFLILSTAGVLPVSAQSLADVARKEGERRQTVKGAAGKTYTDKDLKSVPAAPAADAAAADKAADDTKPADAAAADKAPADKKTDDKGAKAGDSKTAVKDEGYWSARMAAVREQLDRDQTYLSALQNRIDSLTTDFVNRDDPAQQSQIRAEREKALAELDRLKKVVEEDRRAIPELEEEARREGVPAGWLR
jgi:hypothetical protein